MNLSKLSTILHVSDARSKMLRKNILLSAALKIVSISTQFLLVSITIDYLNNEIYGIWLAMTSVLFWFSTMDIGLSTGLRNYLSEAISRNDYEEGRAYLSTTLSVLIKIVLVLFVLTVVTVPFVNFNTLLNTQAIANEELSYILLIAIFFTLVNFVVKNVGYVFVALQQYAMYELLLVLGNLLALVVIWILTMTTSGTLLFAVLAYTASPVLVFIVAAIPVFVRHPQLRPSWKSVDNGLLNKIIGKGLGFFIIQMTSVLVILSSANFIISNACGPDAVTVYNIPYKYFHQLVTALIVIVSPLWNAYTDAVVKNDWAWIKKSYRRTLTFSLLLSVVGLIMLAFSKVFYHLWVGDRVVVPWTVSFCVYIYICMFNLNISATYLINGFNKIRIQIIVSVILTIIYVAVVQIFKKQLGLEGIILSMAACFAIMAAIHMYQCELLIHQKARGIWNK